MNLDYSFRDIKPCWFSGDLPFPEMRTERVKVRLSGRSSSDFPAFLEIGDLLIYRHHPGPEVAVTLLLTYHHSNVPLRTSPPPEGHWYPVPGAPIYGQIRVALSPDAIGHIRKVSAENHSYELSLEGVELRNVTGT